MGLISVVIPAHDASRFLTAALASVSAQTHRDIEVIVADDGSSDTTPDIVAMACERDARIRLLRLPHRGVSAARNSGIETARGDIVATLDADDLWHPQKLEKQAAILHSAPSTVGVVYCWAAGVDADGRVVLPVWNASRAEGHVLHNIVVSGILSNGSTPLMRRDAIERAGGYDETLHLCEDWKFYTALAGVCDFRVVSECLTGYRLSADSASMNIAPMEAAIAGVTRWIRETWPDLPASLFDERERTVNRYLAFLAIRSGDFSLAARYLWRATFGPSGARFHPQTLDLVALMIGQALGVRGYCWEFWRTPQPFLR
jgi:glycosyltransferase involved in cell wall biosynthesis